MVTEKEVKITIGVVWPIKTKRLKCPECGRMGVRFNKRKEDGDAE